MTAILYPVAESADLALGAPKGRAARERAARLVCEGVEVEFVTECAGPAYTTREAALDAWEGRVEDDRPGRQRTLEVQDRYCRLVEQIAGRPPLPLRPANTDGRRWPEPNEAPTTVWRLSVSYWRPRSIGQDIEAPQARRARKGQAGELAPETLKAIARQPLRAILPQRPLDIGLFEVRRPEAPYSLMADE